MFGLLSWDAVFRRVILTPFLIPCLKSVSTVIVLMQVTRRFIPRLVDPAERVRAFPVGGELHWPIGALTNLKIIVTAGMILLNIFFHLNRFLTCDSSA